MAKKIGICRFLEKDLKKLVIEFKMDMKKIKVPVKKEEEYRIHKVTKNVVLVKYYTAKVTRECSNGLITRYIRHNYYLQGNMDTIKDILSKTCGMKIRGCFVPLVLI